MSAQEARPPIPETMWTAELRGAGFESLSVVERPVPQPGPRQILCRVEAASVSPVDVDLVQQGRAHRSLFGWDPARWPIVPGSAGSLVVAAVGQGIGHRFRVGQRLAVSPDLIGPPRLDQERYGESAQDICSVTVGFTVPGFLAQYVLLREDVLDAGANLIQIDSPPSALSHFGVALGRSLSKVVAAQASMVHILRSGLDGERTLRAGILPGGVAVVVGAGPMGILHACHALLRRPGHLIISEPRPERRAAAERLASLADMESTRLHVVEPGRLAQTVRSASLGRGANDIIFAVGSAQAQEGALALAGQGCCVSFFAPNPIQDAVVRLGALDVHYKGLAISGSSGNEPGDLRRAIELQERGAIDLGPFVSAVGGIGAAGTALRAVAEGRFAGKVVIYPHAHAPEVVPVEGWGSEAETRFLAETDGAD